MDYIYAHRNPYEEAELFAMLERMRRIGELDVQMERELGELLIATAKYAITCGRKRDISFKGEDVLSRCTVYALEASRKADTSKPHQFVSYMISAVQTNWIRDAGVEANRHKLLFPLTDGDGLELHANIDGEQTGIPQWESLRLYTIKHKEAEDGQNQTLRGCDGGDGEGVEPAQPGRDDC